MDAPWRCVIPDKKGVKSALNAEVSLCVTLWLPVTGSDRGPIPMKPGILLPP